MYWVCGGIKRVPAWPVYNPGRTSKSRRLLHPAVQPERESETSLPHCTAIKFGRLLECEFLPQPAFESVKSTVIGREVDHKPLRQIRMRLPCRKAPARLTSPLPASRKCTSRLSFSLGRDPDLLEDIERIVDAGFVAPVLDQNLVLVAAHPRW